MIIDIRADLLRRQLAELQEVHAFWSSQPGQVTYTLATVQQQIDELQAQLKAVEAGQ